MLATDLSVEVSVPMRNFFLHESMFSGRLQAPWVLIRTLVINYFETALKLQEPSHQLEYLATKINFMLYQKR